MTGTALVTGASRGIGRAVACSLAAEGFRVFAGVRDVAAAPPGTEPELLDLRSPESIAACASRLVERLGPGGKLDVLVNNAAVNGVSPREVWEVNLRGPLLLTRMLEGLLRPGSRVVMVSSGMGSLASQSAALAARLRAADFDGLLALVNDAPGGYGASKAALNALTQAYAAEWKDRGVLVNSVCPGWVRTEMGGKGAPRSLEQGAASVLWAARLRPDGPTAGFFRDGHAIPW